VKNVVLLVPAICISVVFLANLDGALPENTAAPNELTCGRVVCHNIPVNAGDAQMSIIFNNGDSTYMTDSVYSVKVKIEDPTTIRNGFQILALGQFNQNAGTWQLTEPDKMKVIPGISFPNRKYVTHKAAGNLQNEWTMNWEAPSVSVGKVTFYASVLSANNNGMNTGDEVYNTKIEVQFSTASAAIEVLEGYFKIYPVPATSGFWVEMPEGLEACRFSLHNSSGTNVVAQAESRVERHFIETNGLPGGVYLLVIETERQRVVKRIVVQ
jgi:hypothetical protein